MRVCHSRIKRSLVRAVHPGPAGQPDTMEEGIMGRQHSQTLSLSHVSDNPSVANDSASYHGVQAVFNLGLSIFRSHETARESVLMIVLTKRNAK